MSAKHPISRDGVGGGDVINSLIAGTAHEAKNLMGICLERMDALRAQYAQNPELQRELNGIHTDIAKINHSLVRMLTLYKLDHASYALNPSHQIVNDLLEDQCLIFTPTLNNRGLTLSLGCSADLMGYFDENLMAGMITDALHNAIQHARKNIQISANSVPSGGIEIHIEDDGEGVAFSAVTQPKAEVGFSVGRTGLGMQFATLVAKLHEKNGVFGEVGLDNHSRLGGAHWWVRLP